MTQSPAAPLFAGSRARGKLGALLLGIIRLTGASAMAADGLTTIASAHGPAETEQRLAAALAQKGLTVFARIDHAAGAAAVGMSLRPTTVLIFGAAKAGTPLMQAAQTIGIDLPLKALVWQDAAGKTWLSHNDPRWLARRHGLDPAAAPAAEAMAAGLDALARAITAP